MFNNYLKYYYSAERQLISLIFFKNDSIFWIFFFKTLDIFQKKLKLFTRVQLRNNRCIKLLIVCCRAWECILIMDVDWGLCTGAGCFLGVTACYYLGKASAWYYYYVYACFFLYTYISTYQLSSLQPVIKFWVNCTCSVEYSINWIN